MFSLIPSYQSHLNGPFTSVDLRGMLNQTLHEILDSGGCLLTTGASPSTVSLRYCQKKQHLLHHDWCMGSKPPTSYISSMSSSQTSHYTHAWLPSLANPLDFLNKSLARNLASLDASISHSHRRVFIRHIERILQQPYIRRLQRLESLVQPVYQHI